MKANKLSILKELMEIYTNLDYIISSKFSFISIMYTNVTLTGLPLTFAETGVRESMEVYILYHISKCLKVIYQVKVAQSCMTL